MNRKLMMEKAALCYNHSSFSGIKDSVFGVLPNIVKSTIGSEIEPIREVLDYIRKLNQSNNNYMGVKVRELQKVVDGLFVVDHEILPKKLFEGYTKQDILGYIEICRRMHKVKEDEAKIDRSHNNEKKSQIDCSRKSEKNEYTIIELKMEINFNRDTKAAEYLLANQEKFKAEKGLLKKARKILEK